MINEIISSGFLDSELSFNFSRSSGPGGQNVNKVNTRVELRFNIEESKLLKDEQKIILKNKLSHKINNAGEILIISQSERSQLANKEAVTEKFYNVINRALTPVKLRKKTKPSRESIENRLKKKKEQAEKKSRRQKL